MAAVVVAPLGDMVIVTDRIAQALGLSARDTVNECALVVTTDARRRTAGMLGPEQRMSGVTTTRRNGKRSRLTAETIDKGGARINPYFRQADSVTRPVALIGVRGPAHYIEHPRHGGYTIKPVRKRSFATSVPLLDLFASTATGAATRRAIRETARRPALRIGGDYYSGQAPGSGFYAAAKGGGIGSPKAPITRAFRAAPQTIEAVAVKALTQGFERQMGKPTTFRSRGNR